MWYMVSVVSFLLHMEQGIVWNPTNVSGIVSSVVDKAHYDCNACLLHALIMCYKFFMYYIKKSSSSCYYVYKKFYNNPAWNFL